MRTPLLFLNVLIIAACGLVYELIAGTIASYVLGDSVTQFSLIIGLYLSALGVGAWLSRFLDTKLAEKFVHVELAVALIGGFSAPFLFISYPRVAAFRVILFSVVFIIGTLVGLELPLLMRILKEHLDFKELVSRVLSFDYIGSLFAAVLFPILLVPRMGLIRTSIAFGLLNAVVGLYGTVLMRSIMTSNVRWLQFRAWIVIVLLVAGFVKANTLTTLAEDDLYADPIVYAKSSPYQRIVVTKNRTGFQLFLNNNLQFSSSDEYRYHESLVHPAFAVAKQPRRVLILGGGDGLALREVLKYPSVTKVTLVDLDPAMTSLARDFAPLAALNGQALRDSRVEVVNQDAMLWVEKPRQPYDVAIIDFPDPNSFSLGKLYTTRFYKMLRRSLTPEATVGIQSTSPLYARRSYWCIVRTLEASGFHVRPYQTVVPAFGVWGFALASQQPVPMPARVPAGLRFLDDRTLASLFVFSRDTGPLPVEINRLDNQILVRYYEDEWREWS